MIRPIANVNNTPNKQISFKSGVQTNYGVNVPSPKYNIVEGGLLTGFVGTISPSYRQAQSRANKIENGLSSKNKLNFFA